MNSHFFHLQEQLIVSTHRKSKLTANRSLDGEIIFTSNLFIEPDEDGKWEKPKKKSL